MKAMILAAGYGLRMRPLTLTTPKPLIKVQDHALIDYHLHALKKANITDVVINVHHLGDQIIDHVTAHWNDSFQLHFFKEQEILGTGGGVRQALSVFADEPFILLSADIFTDYPFEKLPQELNGFLGHLVMTDNPECNQKGDFHLTEKGLISFDEGERLNYGNIGVFDPKFFTTNPNEKFELRDILIPAVKNNQITGEHYHGFWENIGTVKQLKELHDSCLVHISKTSFKITRMGPITRQLVGIVKLPKEFEKFKSSKDFPRREY